MSLRARVARLEREGGIVDIAKVILDARAVGQCRSVEDLRVEAEALRRDGSPLAGRILEARQRAA